MYRFYKFLPKQILIGQLLDWQMDKTDSLINPALHTHVEGNEVLRSPQYWGKETCCYGNGYTEWLQESVFKDATFG